MIPTLILSKSNISSELVQFLQFSFHTIIAFPRLVVSCLWSGNESSLMSCRYSGLFPSGWSRSPYCHSYSCYNGPGRQTPSPPTIFLPWGSIGHSTSRTGPSAISPKRPSNVHSSLWPLLPESSKRCFTLISFTFTTTSKPKCPRPTKARRVV